MAHRRIDGIGRGDVDVLRRLSLSLSLSLSFSSCLSSDLQFLVSFVPTLPTCHRIRKQKFIKKKKNPHPPFPASKTQKPKRHVILVIHFSLSPIHTHIHLLSFFFLFSFFFLTLLYSTSFFILLPRFSSLPFLVCVCMCVCV